MDTKEEILELRFNGKGIKPDNVSSKELAEIIESYENALTHIILNEHSELKEENIVVSLIKVEENCLKLTFSPKLKSQAFAALLMITTSIQQNNFDNLPFKTVESLQNISSFCKKRNCNSEFRNDANSITPLATINADSNIKISDEYYLIGETIIYGEVQRIGGVEPKLSIRNSIDNFPIYCSVDKEIAKEISKYLYEEVGLKGIAKWEKNTNKIIDFKVTEVTKYEKHSISEGIKGLSNLIGKYWNDVDDVVSEVSKLRQA